MTYLFFDTETTGLPKSLSAPVQYVDNWPRIVQLAWMMTDGDGIVQSYGNHIVRPDGFTIPEGMVHGITDEAAQAYGENIADVLTDFSHDLKDCDAIIAHNLDFDAPILAAEWWRLWNEDPITRHRAFCTNKQTTEWAGIRKGRGLKWPSLAELHERCFGTGFENAHDAMADVTATAHCFFHILRTAPEVFANPYR